MAYFKNQKVFSCKFAARAQDTIACTTAEGGDSNLSGSLHISKFDGHGRISHTKSATYPHALLDCVWRGETVITASSDGCLQFWSPQHERLQPQNQTAHSGAITSLSLLSDDDILLTGSTDAAIKSWDLNTSTSIARITCQDSVIEISASHILGKIVSVVTADRKLAHYDLRQPGSQKLFQETHGVFCCGWSTILPYSLFTGGVDGVINFRDVRFGEMSGVVAHRGGVVKIKSDPHGRSLVLSAGLDGTTVITNERSRRVLEQTLHHSNSVYAVDWSLHNPYLVADGSWDSLLHVYQPNVLQNFNVPSCNKL